MDTQVINTVSDGLQSFLPTIKFHTLDEPGDVMRRAIESNPKITYYLYAYSISGIRGDYELNVEYVHRDTDISDVQLAFSQSECEDLMCLFAWKYKKKLIVIVKRQVDLEETINSFQEKYAVYYSNMTNIEGTKYFTNQLFSVFEFYFDYRIGYVKLTQMEKEVEAEVIRIANLLFLPILSKEAKIYLAHNYLATNVEYVNAKDNRLELSYTQSAFGALVKKRCVCQGFAEAFKRLMDYCGIECKVVYGRISGTSVLHAWNIVSLGTGSSFYHIDVTWDSFKSKPAYNFFCKDDSFFDGKRSWNAEYYPKCCGSYPVLAVARKTIMQNKAKLIANGIDASILDC